MKRVNTIDENTLGIVFAALMPQNELILRICERTGLRVSDVLALRADQLATSFTVVEQKTKKRRKVRLPAKLVNEVLRQSGEIYCFQHRDDKTRHKTRQAVWADLKRAAKAFRLRGDLSPHSLRKHYADELYQKYHDVARVQKALNHSSPEVTMLYILADRIKTLRD